MLKQMLFINSANFQLADIDLSKEIFFVGDNASGKTTTTRAIHFLYNGDGQKLGIPHSKDSFAKHYFPYDDSYIIYVFETFFIFVYKRNDTIRRWFSKQEFNINEIIRDEKLLDFKDIEEYIKKAPLKLKPQTIEEYTSILYGNNKKYLDFSIARIENYKIFLDVFNMIFNIDKAIVTASDIKKAIQKSLDRKDEILSIDYEDFIRKLNKFSKSYNFFKIFDSSRMHLKNALSLKDDLLSLEHNADIKHKAINYRYQFELKEFNKQKENIEQINIQIKKHKGKNSSIKKLYDGFEVRLDGKINLLYKEIVRLEILKEKFDPIEIEEKTLFANKYEGIKEDLGTKEYSLRKLIDKLTTAQQEIENQIKQIKNKIKFTIPHEINQIIYDLSQTEKTNYENEKLEIENEHEVFEDEINDKTRIIKSKIDELEDERNGLTLLMLEEQEVTEKNSQAVIKSLKTQQTIKKHRVVDIDRQILKVQTDKNKLILQYKEHKNKYKKLRYENAKTLSSNRRSLNSKISHAKAIINPIANSFNEFLSNEIDGWEKEIYPIIDKNLLIKSCDELRPEIIDSENSIGFKINTEGLDAIPTKDEALEIIRKTRLDKYELLKNSKAVYRSEVTKLDEEKNALLADIESCKKEIENLIDDKSHFEGDIEKLDNEINDLQEDCKVALEKIVDNAKQKRLDIANKINIADIEIKALAKDVKELNRKTKKKINITERNRDDNIKIITDKEKKKEKIKIKVEQEKIIKLQEEIKSSDEDAIIAKLSKEVKQLENDLRDANNAINFLNEYKKSKDDILKLPKIEKISNRQKSLYKNRKELIKKINIVINNKIDNLNKKNVQLEDRLKKYDQGIRKIQNTDIEIGEEKLETDDLLLDLINSYEDIKTEYRNKKSKFRELVDKLKKLEVHSLIELNFNMENFSEAKSITELENIIDSLNELDNFEKNKYESEKKRSHNNFDTFLKNTIPSKLQSFDDLESDFEKAKASINRGLSHADFGVIREIKLITDTSKSRNDTIATLLQDLSNKVKDTVGLYSHKSLFYHDVSKSVGNIEDIQTILEEIKKKGSKGSINLFDTIDLSISYIENGKKVENKLNIKDESSSGGNILLKVAIAMSILNKYAKKISTDTPFFLIIDEVSKLQSKNQDLIRKYINENGFKTLFITPDPAYPDPNRAIYYTFQNIQEEGEVLEIKQMNIV